MTGLAETSRLMANIKADRDDGKSADEIMAARSEDITQAMQALPWALILTLLPKVLRIIKEVRGGKSLWDVLVENVDTIIEFIEAITPDESDEVDGPIVFN